MSDEAPLYLYGFVSKQIIGAGVKNDLKKNVNSDCIARNAVSGPGFIVRSHGTLAFRHFTQMSSVCPDSSPGRTFILLLCSAHLLDEQNDNDHQIMIYFLSLLLKDVVFHVPVRFVCFSPFCPLFIRPVFLSLFLLIIHNLGQISDWPVAPQCLAISSHNHYQCV